MCKFCNDYKDNKEIYSTLEWKAFANTVCNLTLVIEHYRKDNILCGKLTTGKYKINYCPMCGRKFEEIKC